MTPLTAEKIAELERLLKKALEDVQVSASGSTLYPSDRACLSVSFLAKHGSELLSLAKRVAGAPVGPDLGAAIAVVGRAQQGIIRWSEGRAFGDHVVDCYLLGDLQALIRGLEKQRVALVEIVGGEE